MTISADAELLDLMDSEDPRMVKLEVVDGMGIWELLPTLRHIRSADLIQKSVRRIEGSDCGCVTYQDAAIVFPDGAIRRPDVAIWCREPEEPDGAVTLLPLAVVEVMSKNSKKKDFVLNPEFYLRHGLRDYVAYDPFTGFYRHHRPDRAIAEGYAPATLSFSAGCSVELPPHAP